MGRNASCFRWVLTLAVTLLLPTLSLATEKAADAPPTLEEALSAEPSLSLFAKLFAADADSPSTEKPFTIFAPSNEAIEQSDFAPIESRLETDDRRNIHRIVAGHMVGGLHAADDLLKRGRRKQNSLRTMLGEHVRVKATPDGPVLGTAGLRIARSVRVANGVVHIVDGVLLRRQKIRPQVVRYPRRGRVFLYNRYTGRFLHWGAGRRVVGPSRQRGSAYRVVPLTAQEESLNAFFPWPPPKPTAAFVFPPERFGEVGKSNLLDVERRISGILTARGYGDRLYFAQPGGSGFVILTQLERFTDEGASATSERWSTDVKLGNTFSLLDYIRAVFGRLFGRFRLVVVVVTRDPVKTGTAAVDQPMIDKWRDDGITRLPRSFANIPLTDAHAVHALVYEFRKAQDKPMVFVAAGGSGLDSTQHMQGVGLLENKP